MLDKKNFYINGQWVKPNSSEEIKVIDPATEDNCAVITLGNKADVDMAVNAAKEVTSAWSYAGETSTTSAETKFSPERPLKTLTISLVVMPAISGVPVPGAKAGSSTSISIDK